MPKTILIADNDSGFIKALTQRLTDEPDLAVVSSFDGPDTLKKVRRENPQLIILADDLPVVNGYKLSRLIKFDKRREKTPLIIISKNKNEENISLGKEVGANYFIGRQDVDDLLRAIRNALGRSQT